MRATASKAGLLDKCQAWAKDGAEWTDTESEAARLGTELHRAAAMFIEGTPPPITMISAANLLKWAHLLEWLTDKKKIGWRSEVAFAWNPTTDAAVVLGQNIGRNYPKDGRLCGAADIVCVGWEDFPGVTVYDIKTGHNIDNVRDQMATLGLMAARAYGVESAKLVVVHVQDDGVHIPPPTTMDSFALDAVAATLAEQIAKIPTSKPEPGGHCVGMYCPHRNHCSATREAMEQVVPAGQLVRHERLLGPIRSADEAAYRYHRLRVIDEARDACWDELKAYAALHGGVFLENGKKWAQTPVKGRETKDVRALEQLARDLGASDAQVRSCVKVGAPTTQWRETDRAKKLGGEGHPMPALIDRVGVR